MMCRKRAIQFDIFSCFVLLNVAIPMEDVNVSSVQAIETIGTVNRSNVQLFFLCTSQWSYIWLEESGAISTVQVTYYTSWLQILIYKGAWLSNTMHVPFSNYQCRDLNPGPMGGNYQLYKLFNLNHGVFFIDCFKQSLNWLLLPPIHPPCHPHRTKLFFGKFSILITAKYKKL